MKRNIIAALVIGLIVGALVVGLEMSGSLLRLDRAVSGLFADTTTRLMPALQYGIALVAAAGVAVLTPAASRRGPMWFIGGRLRLPLVGLVPGGWRFEGEFQPLPALARAGL